MCLQFDDIKTVEGWGNIPSNYSHLEFNGLLAMKPADPGLEGLISESDLNCAVSSPNAIYGTRYNHDPPVVPKVRLAKSSNFSSFALSSLKIKPLDMPPFSYTRLTLRGGRAQMHPLEWSVDFPTGFHDMFTVKIQEFSGETWSGLESLQITADFVNGGYNMDWEFCFDDLEIILER